MLKLTIQDEICLIDDADQLLVSGFPWRILHLDNDKNYVHAWNRKQHIYMHRLIAGAGDNEQVDHWDGNSLNNLRLNLRIANGSQNLANRGKPRRKAALTSRFKGVSWDKNRQRWVAFIKAGDVRRQLGRFTDEEAAARAYDAGAVELHGRFARLNFPIEMITVCTLHDLAIPDTPCTCPVVTS
jgi:frataxin-like iron-binding protein CyaY